MRDFGVSVIRTVVPAVVSAVVSFLAVRFGLEVPEKLQAELVAFLTPTLVLAYHGLLRKLEERYPSLGWLLGVAKRPIYSRPDSTN